MLSGVFYEWEKSMNERKKEWDMIRIIACFCVVVIHVAGYGMEIKDPHTTDWMIRNLVVSMVRCAVPIFFMLSGILFMEKKLSIFELYRKYAARIVIAWISWSFLYALIDCVAYKKTHEITGEYFWTHFLGGHYHLWFLPAILTAYLFLPVLQKMIKYLEIKYLLYIGILMLTGIICRETLQPLINSVILDTALKNFPLAEIPVGILYFILGYYLHHYIDYFSGKKCFVIYLGTCILAAVVNALYSLAYKQNMSVTSGYLSIWVVISSAAVFVALEKGLKIKKRKILNEAILRSISECTFGIYLIHTLFIEQVYRRIGLTQEKFPVIVTIILFSDMTFLISYVIIWCLKKIPFIGKWMV